MWQLSLRKLGKVSLCLRTKADTLTALLLWKNSSNLAMCSLSGCNIVVEFLGLLWGGKQMDLSVVQHPQFAWLEMKSSEGPHVDEQLLNSVELPSLAHRFC